MQRLKYLVYSLLAVLILLWVSSVIIIQFEFLSYFLMFAYVVLGIVLIGSTRKSEVSDSLNYSLLATGISAVLIIVFIIIGMLEFLGYIRFYELFKALLNTDIDLFVVTVISFVIFFCVSAIRSIFLLKREEHGKNQKNQIAVHG